MQDDALENRQKKRRYLTDWQARLKQAQDMAPWVQRELEKTDWEIDALTNLPEESIEIPFGEIPTFFENDYRFLEQALPMLPSPDASLFSSTDAFSASGTASVYEYLARIGDLSTPDAVEFSQSYTKKYQEIQSVHNRPNEIRNLLTKLPNLGTLERFNRAENAFMQFKAGVGEKTSAAIEMRTFLDGVKGELFAIAKKWERENMTWATMSERLSDSDVSITQELTRQEKVFSSLMERLSSIGKDRESHSVTDLSHIWTQLLDHVYVMLTLTHTVA